MIPNEDQIVSFLEEFDMSRAQWDSFNEQEKIEFMRIVEEMSLAGHSKTYDLITSSIWEENPPHITTLLADPYYLGGVGGGDLFPCLVEDMVEIFTNPKINEVILTGAIGWGKSFFAALGMAIEVILLLHLKDPQTFCGVAKKTKISIINMSTTAENAQSVLYDKVFQFLKACPWMQDNYPVDEKTGLYFKEKNIHFRPGSSSEMAVIGEDLIGAALDEANFLISSRRSRRAIQAGESDVASIIYNAVARRRISRFAKALNGEVVAPARMWLISSVQFPGDFLERRMDAIREEKLAGYQPSTHIVRYAQWETRLSLPPEDIPYCGKWFAVLYGDAMTASRILTPEGLEYDSEEEAIAAHIDDIPEGCELIAAPIEFRAGFAEDVYGALRDYAGRSTLATSPFFSDTDSFKDAVCRTDCGDIERSHPYAEEQSEIVSPSMFVADRIPVTYGPDGKARPFLNPQEPRVAHFDQSTTRDFTGFAICHFGGYKEKLIKVPETYNNEDGEYRERFVEMIERRPIVIVDFMIRIVPPKGGRVDLDNLRQLLYTFKRLSGIASFHSVTYDQFESESQIAALLSEGYNAGRFSVDRLSVECYGLLRSALSDRRFSCYEYKPFLEDLSSMERTPKGKIDHRQGGTKDVSDCVAACVYKIEELYKRVRLPMYGDAGRDADGAAYEKSFTDQVRGGPSADVFDPLEMVSLIGDLDVW